MEMTPSSRRGTASLVGLLMLSMLVAAVVVPETAQAAVYPLIWPHSGTITTSYHTYRTSCSCYHDAVDISNDHQIGDPIVAAYKGTVYFTGYQAGGAGNYIILRHGNGYETLYAHLSSFAVSEGQAVAQGQLIGREGSTGHSTGPHLHFEVHKNGAKIFVPGAHLSWVTRGNRIPYAYDLPDLTDTKDPVTTAALSGTKGLSGWWTTPVKVTLSAADSGGSGISSTKYRIGNGAWHTYTAPFTLTAQGAQDVDYYSIDKAGNAESARTVLFNIDSVDPVTSVALSGTAGANGWFTSSGVTVAISGTDPGSGLDVRKFRVDGGAWQVYDGPVMVKGDGAHTVDHFATDKAGNSGTSRATAVNIDTRAPATAASLAGTMGGEGWWRSNVVATLTGTDASSGLGSIPYVLDGAASTYTGPVTIAGDGEHALNYHGVDRAGNAEAAKGFTLRVDATAPATTLDIQGPSRVEGGVTYAGGTTRFVLRAADAASGVASSEWSWRGASQTYGGPFGLTGGDGAGTLRWQSVDRAGNREVSRSLNVELDGTPPLLTVQGPPDGGVVATGQQIRIDVAASDARSGLARIEILVDGVVRAAGPGPTLGWDWPAQVESAGPRVLEIRAVDQLGNTAVERRSVAMVALSAQGAVATTERGARLPGDGMVLGQGVAQTGVAVVDDVRATPTPRLPVVGVTNEGGRAGLLVDGQFVGADNLLAGPSDEAQHAATHPPVFPIIGVLVEGGRAGVVVDGQFTGLEEIPGPGEDVPV